MRKSAIALATFAGLLAGAPSAFGATIGVAVSGIGSLVPVGTYVDKSGVLGGGPTDSIEYFIPLTALPATCTYAAGCGLVSDSGIGGTVMSMYLAFTPVGISSPSVLEIYFEDLDLVGASDPSGFLESVEVFNSVGTSLTGLITNIGGFITGNANTQQLLSLALGVISDPFFAELRFAASSTFNGTNTPEYLLPIVRDCVIVEDDLCPPGNTPIPLPAAFPLFATALGGLGLLGWRRKRKAAAAV